MFLKQSITLLFYSFNLSGANVFDSTMVLSTHSYKICSIKSLFTIGSRTDPVWLYVDLGSLLTSIYAAKGLPAYWSNKWFFFEKYFQYWIIFPVNRNSGVQIKSYSLMPRIILPIELASCLRRMFICERKWAISTHARQLS